MKSTRIPMFILVFSVLTISLPSIATASDETEFRGVPWGADLSVHPEMRRVPQEGEGEYCSYVRSGEDLSMGEAMISSITYRSFRNRFVEVRIEALAETREGLEPGLKSGNFLAFRQACQDSFGPTSFAASFERLRAEHFRWEQTGVRKVLKVNFGKNEMILSIVNHDLLKQIQETEAVTQGPAAEVRQEDTALSGEPSGEESPARLEESSGKSNEPERTARGRGNPLSELLRKAGNFLRWIHETSDPSSDHGISAP